MNIIFLILLLTCRSLASTIEAAERLLGSALSTDFETSGMAPWYDSSPSGVKWSVEDTSQPLEPIPAPEPADGTKILRVSRNPPNTFGTALARSPVVTIMPGDEFSFRFWIRSKHIMSNNLEVYWMNGTSEELLVALYSFSSPTNFEWRNITVTIPVTMATETSFRIYGYCGDSEEDAIAIDNIVVGQPYDPNVTTTTSSTEGGTGTTTQGPDTTRTTAPTPPIVPVNCTPSGSLVSSEGKCSRLMSDVCYCRYKPYGWSWPYADWYCRNASMALVSLESVYEERALVTFAGSGAYWSSGRRPSEFDTWTWTSANRPFEYSNWNSVQEASETGVMYFTTQPSTWFATDGITSGMSFICEERRAASLAAAPTVPSITSKADPSGCPANEGYMTWYSGAMLNGRLYCFSSYWSDWDSADRSCRNVNLRLVSLETEAESTVVNQHITQQGYDIGGGFWTSGYCNAVTSSWTWTSSGAAFSYNNFNSTSNAACNSETGGNYVWFNNDRDGKWFINPKYYVRQIVCEQA